MASRACKAICTKDTCTLGQFCVTELSLCFPGIPVWRGLDPGGTGRVSMKLALRGKRILQLGCGNFPKCSHYQCNLERGPTSERTPAPTQYNSVPPPLCPHIPFHVPTVPACSPWSPSFECSCDCLVRGGLWNSWHFSLHGGGGSLGEATH